ncbi:hypothetical protein PFISCL1PPCAC_13778, partial [Pristionchus fissidentatus]
YVIFRDLGRVNNIFLGYFVFFVGPINILVNCFVMFVLTRKELRSTYNFLFFMMALDQTIVIAALTLSVFKSALPWQCIPQSYPLFWVYYEIAFTSIILIFRAHTTWLAVIIALMRLKSIRSSGCSEISFNRVLLLCVATLIFVAAANTPNFFSFTVGWVPLKTICESTESSVEFSN